VQAKVSSCYFYKKWETQENSERIPIACTRWQNPDLQSTFIYNEDCRVLKVLRHLRIDVDADKTAGEFKDEEGCVLWPKVATVLNERFPDIGRYVEYVIKSHSAKGLHILFGLAPLPLSPETEKTQNLARKIQSNLIDIFIELGIGADPASKGLEQFFSTFRNTKNVVHHNRILTARIEKSAKNYLSGGREPILSNLNRSCNQALKDLDVCGGFRLYNHRGREIKLARLFLFLMGFKQDMFNKLDIKESPDYSSLNSIELSYDDLSKIMDTEKRTLYGDFWELESVKKLFFVERLSDRSLLRIGIKPHKNILRRIHRAFFVLAQSKNGYDKPRSFLAKLTPPEFVQEGERNRAIVSWVLALKWAGVSQEEALERVRQIVLRIPGYKTSQACRSSQVKATVCSVYRNRRELAFLKADAPLPDFLSSPSFNKSGNILYLNKLDLILGPKTGSRNFHGLAGDKDYPSFHKQSLKNTEGYPDGPKNHTKELYELLDLEKYINEKAELRLSIGDSEISNQESIATFIRIPSSPQKDALSQTSIQKVKIYAVYYKQRIGFFVEDKLVLCAQKNYHYKLSEVSKTLMKILGFSFDIMKDITHLRKNTKKYEQYHKQVYGDDVHAMQCSRKPRAQEKYCHYVEKKAKELGISFDEYESYKSFCKKVDYFEKTEEFKERFFDVR